MRFLETSFHVSEPGASEQMRKHWKGFTEFPIKQLCVYDDKGNAIASLQDLGNELWETVKDPLTRCSDDEVEMFLSAVQEGVLEYSRKGPKNVEEFDSKADSCEVWRTMDCSSIAIKCDFRHR